MNAGTRVRSANGNIGTVVGNMTPSGAFLAIKLDNGRQVTCQASMVTVLADSETPVDISITPALERNEIAEVCECWTHPAYVNASKYCRTCLEAIFS